MQLNFFVSWSDQTMAKSNYSRFLHFRDWTVWFLEFFRGTELALESNEKAASIDWFLGVPLFAQIVTKCMDDLEQLRLTGGGGGGRFIFNKVIKYLNEI